MAYLALDRYLSAQGVFPLKPDICAQARLSETRDPALVVDAVRELGFEAAPPAPAHPGGRSRAKPADPLPGVRLVNGLLAQLRPSSS